MKQMLLVTAIPFALTLIQHHTAAAQEWTRHTIDASSRGADGVRLGDINKDGLPDIVTPWEEGGAVRVAIHPGAERVKEVWPSVTVGNVGSPEDAVLVDLENNGVLDVVTSCEGNTKAMYVHWAPDDLVDIMDSSKWTTEQFTTLPDYMQYMFSAPLDVDNDGDLDLMLGGKNKDAQFGWLQCPSNPRNIADWKWHTLRNIGWTMSIMIEPPDRSVLISDRRGPMKGVYRWHLKNNKNWQREYLGGKDHEVMFLDTNHKGTVAWATKDAGIFVLFEGEEKPIHLPLDQTTGTGKGVALGDINGDGLDDVVVTCEGARDKHGVFAFLQPDTDHGDSATWTWIDIGGKTGTKFDRIEVVDLDGDGDLDVLTCEEREGLGVVWYENP